MESVIPSCINPDCKKTWNREMLTNAFGKTFMNKEYKKKREDDIFKTEKALLPETQPYAVANKQLASIRSEMRLLQARLRELKIQEQFIVRNGPITEHKAKELTTKLTIKCPMKTCNGYVNTSDMKCGICNTHVCSKCHEPKQEENHECNPDTVETVKLLKKDTKSCPNCHVMIHKIEGCDQMYCVNCNTAFSWRTREIVIGRIHNPHYYEYLKSIKGGTVPREIGDIPCGGIPTSWEMRNFTHVLAEHRMITHIQEVEMPQYTTNRITNNRDLRIKFLNGDLHEDEFKRILQRREKESEKKQEISQVLNTCVVASSDIFRMCQRDKNQQKAKEYLKRLFDFTNESMRRISKLYNCVVPIINENTVTHQKLK